jgi:drug/metabolite transporter (DMT)-like permease
LPVPAEARGPRASALLSQRLGVAFLLLLSTVFAGNHVAARVAFDHGASVPTAVTVRAGATALVLAVLLRLQGVPLALPRRTLLRGLAIGVLVAVQSFCIYSAVARIPVGLALLVFQAFPALVVLLTWAGGGARPTRRVLAAMLVALGGLALALDVVGGARALAGQWTVIGAGFGFAATASCVFAVALFLTTRWLQEVDGRMRTLLTLGTTAVLMGALGAATHGLTLPRDATGWLGLSLLTLFYGSGITTIFTIVPRLSAASSMVALNFEPIAALLLGWLILGQALASAQIAGAVVVVAAIASLGAGRR